MDDRISNLADYQRIRASFRWECPAEFNFGYDVVDAWTNKAPDRTAIHWVGQNTESVISFADVTRRSNQVAQALAR